MKVAISHDYLNQFGGAERVLSALLEIFPDADLYTLLHDEGKTLHLFGDRVRGTSFLDRPFIRENHRMFIPFMPLACQSVNPDTEYDLVISSTAGYSKGFAVVGNYHLSYCHSPLRYAWERNQMKDFANAPWPLKQFFAKPIAEGLRRWDKRASRNVNTFVVNSKHIAGKVKSYYGRMARVVYPPVDTTKFYKEDSDGSDDYYLMVGRMLYYKLFDLGIETFNRLNKPLKIVGSGPEKAVLEKQANGNVEFISGISDDELREVYNNARALVFPQIEDFGLVAAEAHVCGLPVIAYDEGGAREIVEDGKTGLLFSRQDPDTLASAVRDFEEMKFDRRYIADRGRTFSKERFKEGIQRVLEEDGISI